MVLIIIITLFFITYITAGIAVSKSETIPLWARTFFAPYTLLAKSINIPLIPPITDIPTTYVPTPSVLETKLEIEEPIIDEKLKNQYTKKPGCLIQVSAYKQLVRNSKGLNYSNISDPQNTNFVRNICDVGNNIYKDRCNNMFFEPIKSPSFSTMCCNSSADSEDCTTSSFECTINKSNFINQDYNIKNITTFDNDYNKNLLLNYCSTGKRIIDNDCIKDDYHPNFFPNYKKLCCNDTDVCDESSIQCTIDNSLFKTQDRTVSPLLTNIESISTNKEIVTDYCKVGTNLLTKCNNPNVFTSPNYKELCCTNPNNKDSCSTDALQCTFDYSDYTNKKDIYKMVNVDNYKDNIDLITEFCNLGNKMKTCNINTIKDEEYRNLCCNGSTDINKCNLDSLNCLINSSKYNYEENRVGAYSINNYNENKSVISSYCDLSKEVQSNCNKPPSTTFKKICCNDSTNKDDCNTNSEDCLFSSSDFFDNNNSIQTVNLENINPNKDIVKNYCKQGIELMDNGCIHLNPMNYNKFREFCCNDTNDKNNCTISSLNCLTNSSDFVNIDYELQNVGFDTINIDKLNKYCSIGKQLITDDCKQLNPKNYPKYNELCSQLECSINSSIFLDKTDNISNVTINTAISNQLNVTDFCKSGYKLIENTCSLDPKSVSKFRELCCVNNNCNDTNLEQVFKISSFTNLQPQIENLTIQNYDKTIVNEFCSLGYDINKFNPTTPMSSTKFREFCCNNSSNINDCNIAALTCLDNSNNFKLLEPDLSQITESNMMENITKITDVCDIGINLINNNCNENPMLSSNFIKYCCNDSTNKENCNENSITCISNEASFLNKNAAVETMRSVDLLEPTNLNIMKEYCNSGTKILTNNCERVNPLSYPAFTKFCCNNTSIKENCNDTLDCDITTSKFSSRDITVTGIPLTAVNTNLDVVTDYCNLGYELTNKGCKIENPINSETYRKYCCNTELDNCTPTSFNCTTQASSFLNQQESMGTINTLTNQQQVQEFCELGYSLQNNNCKIINPINYSSFRKNCCGDTNDTTKCNINSFNCLVNDLKFTNNSNQLINTSISNISTTDVNSFCNLGFTQLNTCENTTVNPTSSSKFKDYCCLDSTDKTLCNDSSMQCTLAEINFSNNAYTQALNFTNVTANIGNNADTIRNYCNQGYTLLNTTCNSNIPMQNSSFITQCCTGASKSTCNISSAECNISNSKLYSLYNTMINAGVKSTPDTMDISAQYNLKSNIGTYCNLIDNINSSGCKVMFPPTTNLSGWCPIKDCIPDISSYKNEVDRLRVYSSIFNTIGNSTGACIIGNNIKNNCTNMNTWVDGYSNSFYNNICPINNNCSTSIRNYDSYKRGYQSSPNDSTKTEVCRSGNLVVDTCKEPNNTTLISQVVNDAIYKYACPPIDCVVSSWGNPSPCDCKGGDVGTQTQIRTITTQPQNYGSKECPPLLQTNNCTQCGPLDCVVSNWSNWSNCSSTTCSEGTQTRTRSVVTPAYNGGICPPLIETKSCTGPCDCVVSDWSSWPTCPAVDNCVNEAPTSTRTRTVLRDSTLGGASCPSLSETLPCSTNCNYRLLKDKYMYNIDITFQTLQSNTMSSSEECARTCINNPNCKSAAYGFSCSGINQCSCAQFNGSSSLYSRPNTTIITRSNPVTTSIPQ